MASGFIEHRVEAKLGPLSCDDPDYDVSPQEAALLNVVFSSEPMRTYAIMDGSKIVNLKDWLETSGLEFAPLLQGDAQDELEEIAPYLVVLDPESRQSRQLLTRSDAPWHFWDRDGVIFLQSRADLENVRHHLRRMTRLRKADGSWVLFRFWSPATAMGLQRVFLQSEGHVHAFFGEIISRLMIKPPGRDRFWVYAPKTYKAAPISQFTLEEEVVTSMTRHSALAQVHGLQAQASERLRQHDRDTYSKMLEHGPAQRFKNAKALYRMGLDDTHQATILLAIVYGTGLNVLTEPAFHYATKNSLLAPRAKARQLIKAYQFIEKMKG